MKNKTAAALILSCALALSGCSRGKSNSSDTSGSSQSDGVNSSTSTDGQNFPDNSNQPADPGFPGGQDFKRPGVNNPFGGGNDPFGGGNAETAENTYGQSAVGDTADLFSKRDLKQTADTSGAKYISLESSKTFDITAEGIYVVSGTASDCTIRINAPKDAKVQLVLNGAKITNSDFACVYVLSADKVFITTTKTENSMSVTGTFKPDGSTNVDAVIFSKDDLVLNGEGTLTVNSSANGITCKDDLKITGGTYDVTSKNHGFEAHDSISINAGNFTVNSKKDGFHCHYDDDSTVGQIYISGGTFSITASSDGIQATTIAQIDGGNFTIKASEGIEATFVQINGGTININASDDGINASKKSSSYSPVIEFNGGNITIVMGAGDTDAVDANGCIYVNGGNINITAQSAFDADAKAELNGGTVYVNGSQITEINAQQFGPGGFNRPGINPGTNPGAYPGTKPNRGDRSPGTKPGFDGVTSATNLPASTA